MSTVAVWRPEEPLRLAWTCLTMGDWGKMVSGLVPRGVGCDDAAEQNSHGGTSVVSPAGRWLREQLGLGLTAQHEAGELLATAPDPLLKLRSSTGPVLGVHPLA